MAYVVAFVVATSSLTSFVRLSPLTLRNFSIACFRPFSAIGFVVSTLASFPTIKSADSAVVFLRQSPKVSELTP